MTDTAAGKYLNSELPLFSAEWPRPLRASYRDIPRRGEGSMW